MSETVTVRIICDLEFSLKFAEDQLLKIRSSKSTATLFCHDSHRHQLENNIMLRLGHDNANDLNTT